ncbi:nucleotide kinase [Providencia phage PSTRCR_128]|nr:nucleotide kinase [Providencia phage PSTRCR_128]
MVTLENANINNLEKLVEQNKDKSHASKCNHIKCVGVICARCPMSSKHGVGATLGDVRMEVYKRKVEPTESHKGGGAGIYVTGKSEPIEFIKTRTGFGTDVDTAVYHPKHYEVIDEVEAIQVIARSMTVEQFKGYCLGNILKYRLRLGAKDAVEQDLKKAQNYKDIFEKFKGLCHDAAK